MKFLYLLLLLINFFSLTVFSSESNTFEYEGNIVKIDLINKSEDTVKLGINFSLYKGCKIYWKYPGDSGAPPVLTLEDHTTADIVDIRWPLPSELYEEEVDLTTRVYTNNIILPTYIKLKENYLNKENILKVKLNFQICREICIPINTSFEIIIPKNDFLDKNKAKNIVKYESQVPKNLSLSNNYEKNYIKYKKNNLIVNIRKKNSSIKKINKQKVKAFVHNDYFPTFRLEDIKEDNKYVNLTFTGIADENKDNFQNLSEVEVYVNFNNEILEWKQKISIDNNISSKVINSNILIILIFSLLGGMILNFMPCVLPVLGLKITSFMGQINSNKKIIKMSSLAVVLGIIFTFMIFSIISIVLRIIGINVGWGMQFQNSTFLVFISIMIILFILNLIGYFNISVPRFINKLASNSLKTKHNNIYVQNFFVGMFSTILATPCTAPFVGGAISVALTQNYIISNLIFFFMAIGKSSPYLVFVFYPKIATYLPKPGKWIKYIKYIFALLLLLTLIWIISLLLVTKDNLKVDNKNRWETFSEDKIQSYLMKNEIIFVDITAKWCLSCAVNKIVVLDDKEINELLDKKEVIKLRADWTFKDDKILSYLNKHDRFGIPFNIFYSKNYPDGIILNELLTKDQIIKALEKVSAE